MKTVLFLRTLCAAAVLIPLASVPVFAGALKGLNGHTASGSATISNAKVELGTDFVFDGGPDVYVAVRTDGKIHLLAKLRDNTGAQSYSLPNNLSLGGKDEILLFCKKFNVPLAKAPAS